MSSYRYLDILPFDPLVLPSREVRLAVDLEDLTRKIQDKFPISEVRFMPHDGSGSVVLYIINEGSSFKNDPLVLATFSEGFGSISYYPKRLSKPLIFWYRQYIPLEHPLFFVVPEDGYVAELTGQTTLEDIDKMYPFPMSEE